MSLIRVRARQKGISNYINCQRGTWLGNPFPINRYGRKKGIEYFEFYFNQRLEWDQILYNYLFDLYKQSLTKDIYLGCTCKEGELCHVDSIIKIIESFAYIITKENCKDPKKLLEKLPSILNRAKEMKKEVKE